MKSNLEINGTGFYCNDWPKIKILLNDNVLYDGEICNDQVFKFHDLEFIEKNQLSIIQYGKRFGEDNIWDTKVDDNNQIVEDRHFTINDISINSISMKEIWHHGFFSNNEVIESHKTNLFFGFNISYTFEFEVPFYNWLIDKKREGFLEIGPTWKKSALNSLPDGYSISLIKIESLFDDIDQEIKKL